jgi:hypothetical protein
VRRIAGLAQQRRIVDAAELGSRLQQPVPYDPAILAISPV